MRASEDVKIRQTQQIRRENFKNIGVTATLSKARMDNSDVAILLNQQRIKKGIEKKLVKKRLTKKTCATSGQIISYLASFFRHEKKVLL